MSNECLPRFLVSARPLCNWIGPPMEPMDGRGCQVYEVFQPCDILFEFRVARIRDYTIRSRASQR
jgi:hypothetical protein